jgi:phosphoribosylamine--glycine ligase
MMAVADKSLNRIRLEWDDSACVSVVMASGGYPGNYRTGMPISGLEKVDKDIQVFHAGTRTEGDNGTVITDGGRVLTVTASGKDMSEARRKVYANIERIRFDRCHYRKDIALREVK